MTPPVGRWPWPLRDLAGEVALQGADCRACARPVAAPIGQPTTAQVCLYCALDLGLDPEVDEPLAKGTE